MVEVEKDKPVYVISVVAEMLSTTQQQLRIYEKENLVVPKRTQRNTRLYSQNDIEILQRIITLHQDLGVNLAGIEVILNMRKMMDEMQSEFMLFVDEVRSRYGFSYGPSRASGEECTDLIPLPKKHSIVPAKRSRQKNDI